MFDPHQKSTGTQYTLTTALLIVAFIFSPAVLALSRPVGYLSVTMALTCSVLCASLALLSWKRHSQLTIPSMETPDPRLK